MIRTLWVLLAVGGSTVFYGGRAIVRSVVGGRGPDYYAEMTRRWARAVLRASGTPVVAHGVENVRAGVPVVVVSNHVSWYDIFALASVMPGVFAFVAKKELERIPLFGTAWKVAGHVSIDRSNRQSAVESLRRAGEKIRREGAAVIIFPEGTRSRSGRMLPFKKGAFMLALEAGVPVVPTVVTGSYDIKRPNEWTIRPGVVHLHFGAPVPVDAYAPDSADALVAEVRARMVAALGEMEELPPETD